MFFFENCIKAESNKYYCWDNEAEQFIMLTTTPVAIEDIAPDLIYTYIKALISRRDK